ncbi:MAG: PorV/PorQ family protein [Ignavibacteriales bacterium]|nr:PorV/PorQ family protein [Ignavibacteriales bacterium]
MKTKRIEVLSALVAALLFQPVAGQIVKKAQVGFRFLENPISAEVIGRGGVGVTTTTNSGGIFWNPSLIVWISSDIDVGLNYTKGIADIDYNAVSAAFRLGELGVVGVSGLMMDYGTFYGTRRSDNADGFEETGSFSPSALALGVAFSQKVSDRFSYGVHVKYARQDLGSAWVAPTGTTFGDAGFTVSQRGYAESGFALDVGAFYDFLYNGIRFGATLQNISREIRYENEPFPMPFAVSFGVTVEPLLFFSESERNVLVLSFESRHPRDYKEKVKFGGEYRFMEIFVGRAGYMMNYDERGFTAGFGVRQDLEGVPLRLDYAYEAFGIFGAVHHVSLGLSY